METFLTIIGAIIGIAMLVGIYYLLKICLMYILTALFCGVILGLISAFIGSQIAPDYTAVVGIVGAGIVESMTHTDPNGTVYTVSDQYGNKKKVKKTGNGVLGETYYKDSKGNSYESTYGSNELK